MKFLLDHDVPDDIEFSRACRTGVTSGSHHPHSSAHAPQERAALVRLLDNAGEIGVRGNINFA